VWAELQRHVAGQFHDDVALLLNRTQALEATSHGRRAASERASMTAARRAAVFANLAVDSALRWRKRISSC
jgi:hypothetical protein